jgi:hypothetical protein
MPALKQQLAAILQNPEDYPSRHGSIHADITEQVYGENTDGRAAERQLERLVKMIARGDQ